MVQVAVVCKQEQTFGVGVESSDRHNTRLRWHEVDDGPALLWVVGGGDDASRLVQQPVDETGCRPDRNAIDLDSITAWVDPATELRDFAIDPDATGGDQFLDRSTTSDTGLGEHLLKPDAVG